MALSQVCTIVSLSLVSSCQLLAKRTKGSFANSRHRNDFVVLSNYTCNRALSMMPSMNVATTAFNVHRMLFQLRPLLLPPLAPPITPISGAINTNFGERKTAPRSHVSSGLCLFNFCKHHFTVLQLIQKLCVFFLNFWWDFYSR